MLFNIGLLLLSLGIILLSAELFTNGIEWLGRKMKLSDGAVGSVLAAVGTALPETMIPILAIILGKSKTSEEIGIGAILGAPFMLGTLAFFVTGVAVIIFRLMGKRGTVLNVNKRVMRRDLGFFLVVYTFAILASFLPEGKIFVAVLLVLAYGVYLYRTFSEGEAESHDDLCILWCDRKNPNPRLRKILFQVALALTGIVIGAEIFVHTTAEVAEVLKVPAFILAVIITPIATELPEKFNSVIWMSKRKDTLALGNITGAMVFQSSIIPAIGILLTPWQLQIPALVTAIIALVSAGLIYLHLVFRKEIRAHHLLGGGVFYGLFLYLVLTNVLTGLHL
jgi:cation:H+ antiporter